MRVTTKEEKVMDETVRDLARQRFVCDEIEIDDDARILATASGEGRWVAAWLFVECDSEGQS